MKITIVLAQKRKEKQWTGYALSKVSGVSTGTISEIENGVHMPSVIVLVKLAIALEIKVDDLIKIEL